MRARTLRGEVHATCGNMRSARYTHALHNPEEVYKDLHRRTHKKPEKNKWNNKLEQIHHPA